MTESATTVLRNALTEDSEHRRQRVTVYLNARTAGSAQSGRWISEIGFYNEYPFSYAEVNASNLLPNSTEDAREISRILLVPYGRSRDSRRLSSAAPADRVVRSTRAPGAAGLSAYPNDPSYLGCADLEADGSCPAKTQGLLSSLRTSGGSAVHAVVTRSGAVYICAPLDSIAAPVSGASDAVCVAVETVCRRRRNGTTVEEAPWSDAMTVSLSVLIAKIRSAYQAITDERVQYAVRSEGDTLNPWFTQTPEPKATLLGLSASEGIYNVSTEVFLRRPPSTQRRAEAQVSLGGRDNADTIGASSVLLGAYVDLAAMDRSDAMQAAGRMRVFVQRARVSHQSGDEGSEAAADVGGAEQMAPIIPPAENTSPHVFNYATGLWGDGEVV